jgi:2-isopropylmalate synthase
MATDREGSLRSHDKPLLHGEDKKIFIFDTTLRDGQQCPGAAISFERNLEYARIATEVGVDVLEAGFPAASKLDFDIVHTIASEFTDQRNGPIIAALCQLRIEQIECTIESLLPAVPRNRARLHVYLPVAPELMAASLGDRADDKAALVQDTFDFCSRAHKAGLEVEFSPEGYSRMGENFDFTTDVLRAAVDAGATVLNCPDTIGGGFWLQGENYFVQSMKRHAALLSQEFPKRSIVWSTHCHNDFGLALHNSLASVFEGPCRQIEGCFNGIGERAGNVSLEQCILAIKHFGPIVDPHSPFFTSINVEKLQKISDFVAKWMLPRQPHWPITGENAARHSSGGHTNAILKDPLAYQAFDPRENGKEISFVFGPLSGGNHAQSIIQERGYLCADEEKSTIAQFIKEHYNTRRKGVTDDEVLNAYIEYRKPIAVTSFDYGKRGTHSEISLEGRFFSEHGTVQDSYEGRESALATLKKAIDRRFSGLQIVNYQSESVGSGISAISRSSILLSDAQGRNFTGVGEDTDIEISAMKALVDGTNKAYIECHFRERIASVRLRSQKELQR